MRVLASLLTLAFSALLSGCAAKPASEATVTPAAPTPTATQSNGLAGTSWRLVDLAGTPAAEKIEATLEFTEAGKVSGRGSCNRFFGTVEISGESIRFGPLAATKMSCGDAADAQEVRYLRALQGAERFVFDGDALLVFAKGLAQPLRFVQK